MKFTITHRTDDEQEYDAIMDVIKLFEFKNRNKKVER